MNYSETCPHCGSKITAYAVHLNEPLVAAFVAFAITRLASPGPILKRALTLSHSQYGNFQKLRYFGLIEKREGDRWDMTSRGWSFINGSASVLTPAGQFGNSALPADHKAWETHEGERRAVVIQDVLPAEWRERAEYAAQKAGAA